MGIAATLFDSIRAFLISSTVPMVARPVGGAGGPGGAAGGVFGGLLGGNQTRDLGWGTWGC